MTPNDVRRIALGLPEATESEHMGHPDFRSGGKIFATLEPEHEAVVLNLHRDQQRVVVQRDPSVFAPVEGAWGDQGWTSVALGHTAERLLRDALTMAWRNVAPKRAIARLPH